jgi:S1-C subfamily serine protease
MTSRGLSVILIVAVSLVAFTSALARPQHHYVYNEQSGRGWLGVEIQDVTGRMASEKHLSVKSGAYVGRVEDDSPADKAGIMEGDVIVKLNGMSVEDSDDLVRALERAKPKSDAKLEVVRGDAHKNLTATLGRSPGSYSYSYSYSYPPSMPRMPFHFNFSMGNDFDGLVVQEMSRQLADYFEVPGHRGLLVTEVEKESGAETAGFKAGDVIVGVGGSDVADLSDLRDALRKAEDDSTVACSVIRKGKSAKITWRVTEMGDEDDMSGAVGRGWHVHPRLHDEIMDQLKEELKDLGIKLRNEFKGFKESLQNEFFSS